jgi:hypothetical protein
MPAGQWQELKASRKEAGSLEMNETGYRLDSNRTCRTTCRTRIAPPRRKAGKYTTT